MHKDQVGFIPGRQGPDQIRRAIDIISILRSSWDGVEPQEGLLLSIDLQKASDSVSWSYMFQILERWGFGQNFLNIMKALYSAPQAWVWLQDLYSEQFQISKGIRQVCPLSSLVFAIAIETLAIAIRTHPDIHGVRCGLQIHKCAFFVDDLLLFITLPLISLANISGILKEFGRISCLLVNMSPLVLNVLVLSPLDARQPCYLVLLV